MAAVAAALRNRGDDVLGSDSTLYPPTSTFLDLHGIPYHQGFDENNIYQLASDALVIVGNAVGRGNPEVEALLNTRRQYTSLPELIRAELISEKQSLVVAGTHGKTTTTSLTAWTLDVAGLSPGFLIGGIPKNFGSGCRLSIDGGIFVTEGDEYDTAFFDKRSKFLHYRPEIAIINNVEFDHADMFDNLAQVKRAFTHFVNLVPGNGLIIVNGDDIQAMDVVKNAHTPILEIGLGFSNVLRARDLRLINGRTAFTVLDRRNSSYQRFSIPMAGEFNVRNALCALAAARHLGIDDATIQHAFDGFLGVNRRMEVLAEYDGITVIDDFAHHPTALNATLTALREKYPDRRLLACFDPRSNTTTRSIYQNEIAEALSLADIAVIGAIDRPHRYREHERFSPEQAVHELETRGVIARTIPEPSEMVDWVMNVVRSGDVIALCSNGQFGGVGESISTRLRERIGKH